MFKSFPKSLPTLKSLPQAIGLPFLSTQEDAQLRFRSGENGIKRLYGDEVIPLTDVEYWSQYYTLFGSIQDVYGLISAQDVRQTLITQPENLANLLSYLSHHLFTLIPSDLFPTPLSARPSIASSVVSRTVQGQDTTLECLNCLRVLGRVLVIVLEAEGTAREGGVSAGEAFARQYLWARTTINRADVGGAEGREEQEQFTIEDSDDEGEGDGGGARDVGDQSGEGSDPLSRADKKGIKEEKEELPSPAERLFGCTVDLLFCAGFTLPESVRGNGPEGDKINYVIWDKGIGSTVSIGSSAELDRNKTEVLRFLLILLSSPIYTSPTNLASAANPPLSHLVHSLERRLVLSLLCSLLNTSLAVNKPNTVGALPYNHLISKAAEEKAVLVRACLMTLLVALDYTQPREGEPEMGRDGREDNAFRYFVSKLHRKEDFAFILNGILAVFEEQTAVSSSYLPGSKRPVPYILEIFMLLWQLVDLNKRFRAYIFDSNGGADLITYILLTCLDLKDDPSQHGLLRLGAYLLQNLSAEQAFAEALNSPVKLKVPTRWAVPTNSQGSSGNGSDLLIVSIYSIATTPGLNPLFPALCITIANIAPHLRGLGSVASQKLLQLFKAFSAPNFLLADEGHPRLVYCLLDTFNSILHHQLNENPNLVYSILRSHKDFQTLGTFTLVSGLREIQRRKALRAANAENGSNKPSLDSPGLKRTNSEMDMLAEKAALLGREIGDDDGPQQQVSSAGVQTQPLTSPSLDDTATATVNPAKPNETANLANLPPPPIVVQKEMSEKARGKMRAVQPEDLTSPGLEEASMNIPELPDEELMKVAQAGVGPNRYVPTQEWVASWQKGLPLDVVLIAISELLPKIQDQSASSSGAPSSKVFRLLKEVDLSEVLPPAPPISARRFQWSAASAVWLTSLLWGDIYVSGLQAGASGVCVWRDTSVRLFGIKQARDRARGAQAQMGKVFKMIVSGSS